MRTISKSIAVLLVMCFVFQTAFAEEEIMSFYKLYENPKGFSLNQSNLVNNHPFEKIGDLLISGEELTRFDTLRVNVPVFIVSNGKSVQFSITNIKDYKNNRSDFKWKLTDEGASRIEQLDWKKKIGFGALLVQTSFDNDTWETVYSNTNVFSTYQHSLKNFYSAKRSDINAGCYYKVIVAYKMSRKTQQRNFLFFDTSSWENKWIVDVFTFYLLADECSATTTDVDYSSMTITDDSNSGVVGAVFGNATTANRVAGEEIFHAAQGHGFAAEAANMQEAATRGILNGDTVKHVGADIDPMTGHIVKNGADYIIESRNGIITEIQSKYYNTPSATLNACFGDNGLFKYYSSFDDVSQTYVPMIIEVPADQYDQVILLMQKKIKQGRVPYVTDPADAEKIIRKGTITFRQAVNIAKAGNIESLIFDAKNSCVSATSAFSVSVVVTYAVSIWNNDPADIALQKSLYAGIKVGGNAFVTSVLSSQLSKAGLNSLLVPGSEAVIRAIGPKASAVIINAARIGAKPIYGAAAMKSAAKLLRSNAITATVSLAVFAVPDVIDIFRGRISGKQLVKNLAETAGGIGGGMAGAAGGAAGGAAIGSIIPGIGTAVGATVGGIIGALGGGVGGSLGVGAVADLIAEDDADEMLDIITVEFQNLVEEYLLNNDEATNVSNELQKELDTNVLKDMYASRNQHTYARNIVEKLIQAEVKKRKTISTPSDEEMASSMVDILEDIYDEAGLFDAEGTEIPDETMISDGLAGQSDTSGLGDILYEECAILAEEYGLNDEQITNVNSAINRELTEEVLHDLETVDNPNIYARLVVKTLIDEELRKLD
ncbi:MAG: hypothetical protein IJ210_09550 [Clostridia bacterium]|nr:hypothetical protein [Clostridia bacterium]